jgi:fibronectin-binding autotransporter adhesin
MKTPQNIIKTSKAVFTITSLTAFLAASPAVQAGITVWNTASGDFNNAGNWSNLQPGQDGPANQQAVIQGATDIATTSGDYTATSNPAQLLNDYLLVVRSDAGLNIGHDLSTSATDTNTGTVYLGFDAGGGTINHTAGTLTTGTLNIGGFAATGTQTADYNISGTADIDANSIQIRAADNTRKGRLLVGNGVTLDEAITIQHGFSGSITGTGTGGVLSGQITLNNSADFRGVGGNSGITYEGGITTGPSGTESFGLSLNQKAIINSNAIDLNDGTLTLTSNGNNIANATEINVSGNDWGMARINFGGYLKLGVDNAMPIDAGVEFGWNSDGASPGTLDLNGTDQTVAFLRQTTIFSTVNGNQNITNSGNTDSTLTINTAAGSYDYHGRITDGATNSMSIVKNGAGTQIFDNNSGTASDYTGTTTINAGTLALVSNTSNNNIASSSLITVDAGASLDVTGITAAGGFEIVSGQTLAGEGNVSGDTTINSGGFLSAGDGGIGTLTFDALVDVSSVGANSMLFDLASPGFSDLVSMSSSELDIGSGSFDLDTFTFTDLSGPGSRIGVGTYTLFDANSLALGNSLGSTVFTESLLGYATATLFESGGDIFLSVTAVPEPSSTALLGLGGLALMLRRKRSAA